MRFGIREIADVVFRAKATQYLGSRKFYKNEPVLYFDTLKTSSLEGAATTVYATGGRGNTRLVAWEGERTLTFTMEDALISPESFSILSGAGLIAVDKDNPIYIHTTSQVEVKKPNTIELPEEPCWNKHSSDNELYHTGADIFVMTMTNGQIDAEPCIPYKVDGKTLTCYGHAGTIDAGDIVLVDYYVKRTGNAQLIEITADKFGGNYYVEASTLFRDEATGVDMPAEFIIPNCKVQSNFTFSMAATGDPSTFTFTMDAFPDYTKFDRTHKVLAAIQVVTEGVDDTEDTRKPCQPTEIVPYGDSGVQVTYDNAGNETLVKVTATGNNIDGTKYDPELFGTIDGNAVEVDVKFNIDHDKEYTVIQKNPALKKYFKTDPNVNGNVKTKKYEAGKLEEGYGLLVSDQPGLITVTVQDADGATAQVIEITNKVTFAPKTTTETPEILG